MFFGQMILIALAVGFVSNLSDFLPEMFSISGETRFFEAFFGVMFLTIIGIACIAWVAYRSFYRLSESPIRNAHTAVPSQRTNALRFVAFSLALLAGGGYFIFAVHNSGMSPDTKVAWYFSGMMFLFAIIIAVVFVAPTKRSQRDEAVLPAPPSSAVAPLGGESQKNEISPARTPSRHVPFFVVWFWPLLLLLGAVLFKLGTHDYPYEFYRYEGMEAVYQAAQIHGGVLSLALTLVPVLLVAGWTYRRYRGFASSPRRFAFWGLGLLLGGVLFFAGNCAGIVSTQVALAPYDQQRIQEYTRKLERLDVERKQLEDDAEQEKQRELERFRETDQSLKSAAEQATTPEERQRVEIQRREAFTEFETQQKQWEETIRRKREEWDRRRQGSTTWNWDDTGTRSAWKGFRFVFAFTTVVSSLLIVAGAVCAWTHLVRIRRRSPRPGLVTALVAALIPTLPLLWTAPFLLIFAPFADMRGGDAVQVAKSVAFVFGALAGTVAVAFFLRWLFRWLNVSPQEPSQEPIELPKNENQEQQSRRSAVSGIDVKGLLVCFLFILGLGAVFLFSRWPAEMISHPREMETSPVEIERTHTLYDEDVRLVEEKRAIKQDAAEKGLEDAELNRLLEESDRRHEKRVEELEKRYDDTLRRIEEQNEQQADSAVASTPAVIPRLSLMGLVFLLLGIAVTRMGLRQLRKIRQADSRGESRDGLISGATMTLFFPLLFLFFGSFYFGNDVLPWVFLPDHNELAELGQVYGNVFGMLTAFVITIMMVWQTVRWTLCRPASPTRLLWWCGGLLLAAATVFLLSFSMYGTLFAKNNAIAHDAEWQFMLEEQRVWQNLRGKRFDETAALIHDVERSRVSENEQEERKAEIERKYDRLEAENSEQSNKNRSKISMAKYDALQRIRIVTGAGFTLAFLLAFAGGSCYVVYRTTIKRRRSEDASALSPSSAELHSGFMGETPQKSPWPMRWMLVLASLLLTVSIAGAIVTPIYWLKARQPITEARREQRLLEGRLAYWQSRLDNARRSFDPVSIKEAKEGLLVDYTVLYRDYQGRVGTIVDSLSDESQTHNAELLQLEYADRTISSGDDTWKDFFLRAHPGVFYYARKAYFVLLGFLLAGGLSLVFLFRRRHSRQKAESVLAGLVAVLSSLMLLVMPVIDAWLIGIANRNPNFMGVIFDFDGPWALFLLAGFAYYLLSAWLLFATFFGDATKSNPIAAARSRALLALGLVLLPAVIVPPGYYLLDNTPCMPRVYRVEWSVAEKDSVQYRAMLDQYLDDYLALLERHEIPLTRQSLEPPYPGGGLESPKDEPEKSLFQTLTRIDFWRGMDGDKGVRGIPNWSPVERYMADERVLSGYYAAMAIFMTLPLGLVLAVCHFVWLPETSQGRGGITGILAIFFWPMLITIGSAIVFPLAMWDMRRSDYYSDDYFMFLFIAIFGVLFHVAAIWWIRRRLRRSVEREDS